MRSFHKMKTPLMLTSPSAHFPKSPLQSFDFSFKVRFVALGTTFIWPSKLRSKCNAKLVKSTKIPLTTTFVKCPFWKYFYTQFNVRFESPRAVPFRLNGLYTSIAIKFIQ